MAIKYMLQLTEARERSSSMDLLTAISWIWLKIMHRNFCLSRKPWPCYDFSYGL